MCPPRLESAHLWGCLFLQGDFPTPWTFEKSLRNLLYSQGSPFQLYFYCVSWRRLQNFRWILSQFMRKMVGFSVQSSWISSLLSSGCRSSDRLSGGVLAVSCLSLSSLWWQGLRSSWIGLLCDWELCLGKSYLCFLGFSFHDGEGLKSISSLIYNGLFWVDIFTLVLWGREN